LNGFSSELLRSLNSCPNLLSIPLNGFYTITLHVQCGKFSQFHYMDTIPLSPQLGHHVHGVGPGI
jgi:hypothetical protein